MPNQPNNMSFKSDKKMSPAERHLWKTKKRASIAEFVKACDRHMACAAARQFGGVFPGIMCRASQHHMIEKLLNELDDDDELRQIRDGVSAGLASEWIFYHSLGHDIMPAVVIATKGDFSHTIRRVLGPVLKHVIEAQHQPSEIERRQRLMRSCCFQTKTFESRYPFSDLNSFFFSKIQKLRYYYIEGYNHAMAAHVDGLERVRFYDTDIGEAYTDIYAIGFLPYYLRRRVDAMIENHWLGKILGWPKEAKDVKLTFTEYEHRRTSHGMALPEPVVPERVKMLAAKTHPPRDPGYKFVDPSCMPSSPSRNDLVFPRKSPSKK